jgi:CubicO group peptidase (beta-lactamase class C family)
MEDIQKKYTAQHGLPKRFFVRKDPTCDRSERTRQPKSALRKAACLGIAILLGQMSHAQTQVPADMSKRLDEVAASFTKGHAFMGTVLVNDGNATLLDKGYGEASLEWGIPDTPDVKFRIGSLTKQFTAALVLLEQQDGRVSVHDAVGKYLTDAPAAWDKVTVADLLHHTSGIPDFIFDSRYQEWRMVAHTPAEEMAFFRDKPLNFAPGSQFGYSNSNYVLLGMILEKVSGKSYGQLLSERILTPLGMKDSGLDSDDAILLKRASGYQPGADGVAPARYSSMSVAWSVGGMYSTTADLLRWEQGLFSGKLLSAESLTQMTTPAKRGYADGVFVNQREGLTLVEHGGSIEGFNTYMLHSPARNITVIVLSNVSGDVPDRMAVNLFNVTLGKPAVLATFRTAQPYPQTDLEKFAGEYDVSTQLSLSIKPLGDDLIVQASGQPPMLFSYEGDVNGHPQFFTKALDAQIEFMPAAQGHVTDLILHLGGQSMKAKRH